MASKGIEPGNPDSMPVESWRTPAAADVGGVIPDDTATEDGAESELDMPDMGAFSAESARPTPLDDIAGAERENLPKD